jgi:Tfp pilus assembly protein PilF
VSQLFESLRRDRDGAPRIQPSRTAHGDAVLATLGYGRMRRRALPTVLTAVALVLGILAVAWSGWRFYVRSEPARPLPRATSSSPSARRQPPHPATAARPASQPAGTTDAPPTTSSSERRNAELPAPVPERNVRTFAKPSARAAVPTHPAPSSVSPSTVTGSLPAAAAPSVSSPPAAAASAARPASDELAIALQYQRAGDFDAALQHYGAALREDESNAQVHNNLGLLYQEKRLFAESTRELQRALAIDPRNTRARNNLGVTFLMQAKIAEATGEFRKVLASSPQNVDALVNLGLAQRMAWQFDQSKETLMEALALSPRNAATHYNLGQLYDEIHEPARAVEHYRVFLDTAGSEYAARTAAVRARIAVLSRTPE